MSDAHVIEIAVPGATGARGNVGETGATGAPGPATFPLQTARQMQLLVTPGSTSAQFVGFPTASGVGAVTSLLVANGPANRHTTAAATGAVAGIETPYTMVQGQWQPEVTVTFRRATGNARYWVGFFSASPDTIGGNPASLHCAAFRYDTAADGTTYRCLTSNGATVSSLVTSSVVSATSLQRLRVALTAAEARFYVNDVLVATSTANLPSPSAQLGVALRVISLDAVASAIDWGRVGISHS